MNKPRCNEYDYIDFLVATPRSYSCVEAASVQPERDEMPSHDAFTRLVDGSVVPADLLVLATGYQNQQEVVRASLGDDIADAVGPVWNFDAGGELRNMWRPTTQAGLWFTAGSLAQCRIYSKYLALQIKARELGLTGT